MLAVEAPLTMEEMDAPTPVPGLTGEFAPVTEDEVGLESPSPRLYDMVSVSFCACAANPLGVKADGDLRSPNKDRALLVPGVSC